MKHSNLDEGYAIIINRCKEKVLLFVQGKQVSPHVALTYNHLEKTYSYTMIGTGLSINIERYKLIPRNTPCAVQQFEDGLRNDKKTKGAAILGRQFYNNFIRDKKFYEET